MGRCYWTRLGEGRQPQVPAKALGHAVKRIDGHVFENLNRQQCVAIHLKVDDRAGADVCGKGQRLTVCR